MVFDEKHKEWKKLYVRREKKARFLAKRMENPETSSQLPLWKLRKSVHVLSSQLSSPPHTLPPLVALEFCLKVCQCQREAGKEAIFVGVCVT